MALELVGGALLSAFLQVTFEKLASAGIQHYFQHKKLNPKLLNNLNITLLSINAVLDDAELKQFSIQPVRDWLDAVKDALFDAEDLLEEIDYEVTRSKLEAESQSNTTANKVWNLFTASSSSFDKEIEPKMHEVLENLEYLASKIDLLDLKPTSSSSSVGSDSQVSRKLPSTSLPADTAIFGRDVDMEFVSNWLISDDENDTNQPSIITIVAMGGMGKTTLAQHIYNDPKMDEGKFDVKVWVCVSQDFDVFKVMRAILEEITRSTDDSRGLSMVQDRLKEKLSGKRFLLVLDDLWNEKRDQWEALQTPFKYGAQGSKILVTTRNKKVATTMRSTKIHSLEQLQQEHCYKLLCEHAFLDENHQINSDLKDIAKKIVQKCQGLPLALKTIGSLLYTKSSLVEWESILASEIWDLPEEVSNIKPALMLSYHHLPPNLKRCFAYCALFPKNHNFEKKHLISLWMAENFLQCRRQNMSMEEVGEEYFNDLFSRSFFQQSRIYEMHFIMHDLLNDLAKYVSGNFSFTFQDGESLNISNMTRHFSFVDIGSQTVETLYNANRLRTFLPLKFKPFEFQNNHMMSNTLMQELFSKFKFCRVMSLSSFNAQNELPDNIGNLKHLRYLDLSYTRIKKLPDSVCSLYNLQTLKLYYCRKLKELPLNLHKLISLRYLDIRETEVKKMSMNMGKLKNLQVLTSFYVDKGSDSNIEQLGELNLHESLSIYELQNIGNPSDAASANLKTKVHLEKLELVWNANSDNSEKEREVLEKLQPSKHLKELSIWRYGGTRFPDWFGDNSLSNIVNLELSNCENCVVLPALGILPSLKQLQIKGLSGIVVISSEFYGNESSSSSVITPFASLQSLSFDDMEGWEEWDCKTDKCAFPCLENLFINNCPNLKESLPDHLTCLKELEVSNCRQLKTSISLGPSIDKLSLTNCGKLQFDNQPSTIRTLRIGKGCMEGSLREWVGNTLSLPHNSLEVFDIVDFPTMNIPLGYFYNFLETLDISGSCDSLKSFPLHFFPKLRYLIFRKCSCLEMITQDDYKLDYSLTHLIITKCPNFVSFPMGGFSAPILKRFYIRTLENLKSLPECMDTLFPSLTELVIEDCPQLESFSDGGLPSSLESLYLESCSKLLIDSLKWALGINTCLKQLHVRNVDVESFPDEGLLPLSLTSLEIECCPNLKKLDHKGLCHLSSLKRLTLISCPSLQCLPVEGLPKSISTLKITECFLLEQRCKKPNGEDWDKISHIQEVKINVDELIT